MFCNDKHLDTIQLHHLYPEITIVNYIMAISGHISRTRMSQQFCNKLFYHKHEENNEVSKIVEL